MNLVEQKFSEFHSNYVIQEKLGTGCFGLVLKVKDKFTHKVAAVKKISLNPHQGIIQLKEARNQRIAEEIFEGGGLKFGFSKSWLEDKSLFIEMILRKGNLTQLYNKINFSKEKKIFHKLIEQISYQVHLLHLQNYVHLDIKPQNILYDNQGGEYTFYLSDFCLMRKADQDEDQCLEGDSQFLSEERLNYSSWASLDLKKVDIFALGATFFDVLTNGQVSNFNSDQGREFRRNQNFPLKFENFLQIDRKIQQLIISMIDRNHSKRPSSIALMAKIKSFARKQNHIMALLELIQFIIINNVKAQNYK